MIRVEPEVRIRLQELRAWADREGILARLDSALMYLATWGEVEGRENLCVLSHDPTPRSFRFLHLEPLAADEPEGALCYQLDALPGVRFRPRMVGGLIFNERRRDWETHT